MFKRPDPTSAGPKTPFSLLSGLSGPRESPPWPQKTNRGHISINTPRWSPEHAPIGQSSLQAFQNMSGYLNSTISGPDAAVSRGGEGQVATWVGTQVAT